MKRKVDVYFEVNKLVVVRAGKGDGDGQIITALDGARPAKQLAADGKLIKRPLVLASGVALAGFREPAWSEALAPWIEG